MIPRSITLRTLLGPLTFIENSLAITSEPLKVHLSYQTYITEISLYVTLSKSKFIFQMCIPCDVGRLFIPKILTQ